MATIPFAIMYSKQMLATFLLIINTGAAVSHNYVVYRRGASIWQPSEL